MALLGRLSFVKRRSEGYVVRPEDMSELPMEPETGLDELYLARTENRHLQETIRVMRDELEQMQMDKEASLQQAVTIATDEITQLKAMITALRHELERNQSSYAENMQEVERCARDEATQLQQTIRVLRQGLGERDARFATE